MTDYGHELQFGIFPSPDADQVARVVERELLHLLAKHGLN